MKLLLKTTLYYLLIALIVFGIGGVMTFNIIRSQVILELDRYLRHELRKTYNSIENHAPISALQKENLSIVELPGNNYEQTKPIITDTIVYHIYLKRDEKNRKATVIRKINDQYYKITIFDVIVEDDDIYDGILVAFFRMYILLSVVFILAGIIFSRRLLIPFELTLKKIKNFSLTDNQSLVFEPTSTREFRNLNNFITAMTSKAQSDYLSLKEFTENAAHEMQTPLAIAKGKLELMVGNNDLTEEQVELVNSAYMAINKLSRMSSSLALLTKIENREFSNAKELDMSRLLEDMLIHFRELIELKNIQLKTEILPDVMTMMDPILADILLTNLIQNAIRHNVEGGIIDIHLNGLGLSIRNTGHPPAIEPDQMFRRFKKNKQSSESNGLGLSIVKKICEINDFDISYEYHSDWHVVKLLFPA